MKKEKINEIDDEIKFHLEPLIKIRDKVNLENEKEAVRRLNQLNQLVKSVSKHRIKSLSPRSWDLGTKLIEGFKDYNEVISFGITQTVKGGMSKLPLFKHLGVVEDIVNEASDLIAASYVPTIISPTGQEFHSIEKFKKYYIDAKNIIAEKLGSLTGDDYERLLAQWNIFNNDIQIELDRQIDLFKNEAIYNKKKKLDFTNASRYIDRRGSTGIIKDHNSGVIEINRYYEKLKAKNKAGIIETEELATPIQETVVSAGKLANKAKAIVEHTLDEITVYGKDLRDKKPQLLNTPSASVDFEKTNKEIQGFDLNMRKSKLNDEALELENIKGLEAIGMTELYEKKKYEIIEKYTKERLELSKIEAENGNAEAAKDVTKYENSLKNQKKSKPKLSIKGIADEAVFNLVASGIAKIGGSSDGVEEKTNALFGSISQNAKQVSTYVGMLKSSFGGLDEGLDQALDAVGNIASGFASGGIVGGAMALAGEGLKIFANSKKVNKEHKRALELIKEQNKAQEHSYDLSQLKSDLNYDKGDTVFGSDLWGKARNAAENYNKSLSRSKESLKALNDIDIVTGSRKTGGMFKKRKDVYSDILGVYPDLITAEGTLNKARAESVLETQKMSDSSKAALKRMIEDAEQVEAAYAQMKEYMSSMFGDLGNQITDAFVDSFKNGTNAMESFTGSAGAMLENLVKDMVYSMAIAPYIEDASEKMMVITSNEKLTAEQKMKAYTSQMGTLMTDVLQGQELANQLLGMAQIEGNKHGFDLFTPEAPTASAAKGLESMSQDSANELNGSFYALRQQMGDIRNINNEALLVQRTMQNQLGQIVSNTEYCRYLENVKNSLEDIQTRGVKLKV